MCAEYAEQMYEDELYYDYEPPEQTSDVQLPGVVNTLLLAIWIVICLIGFAVIFLGKAPLAGAAIIAVPTFLGMIIKPTFALCLMMLVLPTGSGVGYERVFTLNRGVGIALAISFALNLLITRPKLHIRNKALWVVAAHTFWIGLSALRAPSYYLPMELRHAFVQIQLLAFVFIIYWILETNDEKTFRWALRSYIVGTLGMIAITFMTGAAIRTVEEETGRYAATLGRAIDANMFAVLIAMAFLAAIYLFARDKNLFWRIIYLIAILFLPIMLIRTGSRGALVALAFTLLSPLLFLRQIVHRPLLVVLLLIITILAASSMVLLVKKRGLERGVETRLTDIGNIERAFDYRMRIAKNTLRIGLTMPMGTGYSTYFERAGIRHHPHGDFIYALGVNGIPDAALFVFFVVMMILTVRRIPLGIEKLYARAALTFLLVSGLNITQLYKKYFWVFLAFVMASERISSLIKRVPEIHSKVDEETANTNY